MTTRIFLRHVKRNNLENFNSRIPLIKRLSSSSTFRRRPLHSSKSSVAALTAIRWEDYQKQFKIDNNNNSILSSTSTMTQTSYDSPLSKCKNYFSTFRSSYPVPSPYDDISILMSTWLTKIPKGFENFFPKQKEDSAGDIVSSSETESSSTDSKRSSGKSSNGKSKVDPKNVFFKTKNENGGKDKKKRQKKKSGIPPPGENDPQNIPAMIALLLMISAANGYFKSNNDTNEGNRDGGEITFVDFRNHLLDSGQVDKIIVVNNNLARVILHPGSKGVAQNIHSTSSSLSSSENSMSGGMGSNRSQDDSNETDNTILEFNKLSSTNNAIDSSSSTSDTLASSTVKNTPVYHFYIGSVESFEDKLSKSQSDVHPREWVPVQYVNEVNLLQEFIKVTPMLALGAILFYYSRGLMGGGAAGGGAGGGGGMGGIFQVGGYFSN